MEGGFVATALGLDTLCSPDYLVWTTIYVTACIILAVVLFVAACVRRPLLAQFEKKGCPKPSTTGPQVSVVMPCKGIHPGSLDKKISQVSSTYENREFVFVTETPEDAAAAEIHKISAAVEKKTGKVPRLKCVSPGLTWHNSQKVANLLEGVAQTDAGSKYLLFLDDDVALHPDTIGQLVHELESDPSVFCASGYSFDVPPPHGTIFMYCIFIFRLVNLTAFTLEQPAQLWGGCVLVRRDVFLENQYRVVDIWRDGGYSDDQCLNAVVAQYNKKLIVRRYSIYPNILSDEDNRGTFDFYSNFLYRQLAVMRTYGSGYNSLHNSRLLLVQFIAAVSFVVPMVLIMRHMLMSALSPLLRPNTPWRSDPWCNYALAADIIVVIAQLFLAGSMSYLVHVLARLCELQCQVREKINPKLNWFKLVAGFIVHALYLPWATTCAALAKTIIWSGIKYHIRSGRIWKVERKNEEGKWFSRSRDESMQQFLRRDAARSFPLSAYYERDRND